MKEKSLLDKIIASLDTTSIGFSARKLSGLAVMLCVLVAHGAWLKAAFLKDDFILLPTILGLDFGFILTCLGMTTYQAIKNKSVPGDNNNNIVTPPSSPPAAPIDSTSYATEEKT